jgi:hypothetical protein
MFATTQNTVTQRWRKRTTMKAGQTKACLDISPSFPQRALAFFFAGEGDY